MKTILKIIGILILVAAIGIGGFASFISIRGVPKFNPEVPKLANVEITPERVQKGAKIAAMLCQKCHMDPATGRLSGHHMTEIPEFGVINSRNITHDPEYGIGKWTDAELIYFIRTGINPHTGQFVPPYMPKLIHIADEDMYSIIAYLRSDAPELQPSQTELPPSEPSFLTKFLCFAAFQPFEFPTKSIPEPDTTNIVEWGKYLALYQLECYSCHSESFEKMNMLEPEKSAGFFGGGNPISAEDGSKILSMNLTSDEETGIGKWTAEEFVKAVKYGMVPNGPALRLPMTPYVQLSDDEVRAIYAYLRTVPKIRKKIERGV